MPDDIPPYLDWCPLCHGDGYFLRLGSLWRVCCATEGCSRVSHTADPVTAAQSWNQRMEGQEVVPVSANKEFERDEQRRTGVEHYRYRRGKVANG